MWHAIGSAWYIPDLPFEATFCFVVLWHHALWSLSARATYSVFSQRKVEKSFATQRVMWRILEGGVGVEVGGLVNR